MCFSVGVEDANGCIVANACRDAELWMGANVYMNAKGCECSNVVGSDQEVESKAIL